MEAQISGNIFVVLPPYTKNGVVFGKNSDRPTGEVQEVVYFPPSEQTKMLKCTYIEVEPVNETKAIILSKPNWMWGGEMGGNECGVAIGNQPVWITGNDDGYDLSSKKLLGTDLVRLGLERSSTAEEALKVITGLLENYGQGGPSSNTNPSLCHHDSFIIADPKSAWILETVANHWVAKELKSGYHNLSNTITITTDIDKKSEGIGDYAISIGLWDGKGDFNFSQIFDNGKRDSQQSYLTAKALIEKAIESNNFKEIDMFSILRDIESGVCRTNSTDFSTQASQVSVLSDSKPSVHWFTATPNPALSVFKPFIFTPNVKISKHTVCSDSQQPHALYDYQMSALERGMESIDLLRRMEQDCVKELESVIDNTKGDDLSEFDELMKDCVETEVKFYR